MIRQTLIPTALALVSLGAACTASEPVSSPASATGAAGASPRPAYASLDGASASPASSVEPPMTPATGTAGGGGQSGQAPFATGGTGGAATSAADPAVCAAPSAPPPAVRSPFQPDLSGPVVSAASPPRPVSGGTLLVTHDGVTAVASDPDRDLVYVVDLRSRAVRFTAALSTGDEPGRLVEDARGLVHVALRRGGAVATLDPATGVFTAREAACAAPRGLAYEAGRDLVHVACAEGTLVSLRATGGRFREVALGRRDLRDVVVTGTDTLLVSTFKRADVLVVDGSGSVTEEKRPPARVASPFVADQPHTFSPAVAWRMVPVGDGSVLVLHQRGLDETVVPGPGGYGSGKPCSDGIVESTTTVVAPGATPSVSSRIAMLTLAVDVAVSPDGKSMALAAAGNAGAMTLPVVAMPISAVTQVANGCVSGGPPPGPDGHAVTTPPAPGQVVAVAYTADGVVVAQSRDPDVLWTSDGRGTISLSSETTLDTGHRMFHVDAGGGIACASCHPEGGEDGRTWSFACLGPRRTQSLRGGLSGTEPFHWDGDMADFGHLVNAVFVGRMSGPQPSDAQASAMLRWLDSVPELPTPPPADAAAVERGRALFSSAATGCTGCHAGARLTNNATVDVGTGMKAQVPSLRGVGWRAPFLHTGCAPELADRFGACGGGDRHGHTSQLGPSEVADLTAFLETL